MLTSVLAKLDSTSNNINTIIGAENQSSLKSALADIATVARTLAARKDTLDKGIVAAQQTFENTLRTTERLDSAINRIERSAESVEKMGNEVARISASAGKTVNSVGADVERFTAETLPELENLLGELSALSISMRRLIEQTERNPSGLLFGRKQLQEGPGETSTGEKAP